MKAISLIAVGAAALAAMTSACGGASKTAGPVAATSTSSAQSSPTSTGSASSSTAEVSPTGDIPDTQAFVPYSSATGKFSIKVPEGWARAESGAAVTFSDKFNSITVDTVAASSAPTVTSAQQSEVPSIRAAARNYQAGSVTMVTRKAGPAVLITYRADSAPDAVTGKVVPEAVERYEFWRGGVEAIVTLSAPQGADNVDPWRTVTDSFGWLG